MNKPHGHAVGSPFNNVDVPDRRFSSTPGLPVEEAIMRIDLDQTIARLLAHEVVAIPTETVYGLAADATSELAVAKVFAIKGRPATNPLIVHVDRVDSIGDFARELPATARRLFEAFAPGPISIVLPRGRGIVDAVTAGGGSVAFRIPAHPIARQLLARLGKPLAAPSANRSNQVSPTQPAHVEAELGADFPVLDGGVCDVGIESTVVDCTRIKPRLLRPGSVTRAQIESVVGPIEVAQSVDDVSRAMSSPGRSPRHYSPRTPAVAFEAHERSRWMGRVTERSVLLVVGQAPAVAGVVCALPFDPIEASRLLYASLRGLDELGVEEIVVELPPDTPEWFALRDRLIRATGRG